MGSQKKGGLGDRFRGLAWDKLSIALDFRRSVPVKKEGWVGGRRRKRKWHQLLLTARAEVQVLSPCISLLQWGILGEDPGEVSAECSSVLPVGPFRVMVSTDWSVPGSFVIAVGPGIPHLVSLLFWAWT